MARPTRDSLIEKQSSKSGVPRRRANPGPAQFLRWATTIRYSFARSRVSSVARL